MVACQICGEKKKVSEFYPLPFFTKYKKQVVTWCHDCQKLYIEMKKQRQRHEKLEGFQEKDSFTVSFL